MFSITKASEVNHLSKRSAGMRSLPDDQSGLHKTESPFPEESLELCVDSGRV